VNPAIETSELTKYYPGSRGFTGWLSRERPETLALDRVNLSVDRGELFGLVGPNGAGKTTLIKTLCTLILPTEGSALVNGYPLSEDIAIKASIGLVTSDERSFYWRLSGRQNLEFFATLHNLGRRTIKNRLEEVLEIVGLQSVASKRFLTYSTGMRQRLSIARALLNQPQILFLDEPTKGLDPPGIQALHKLIRQDLTRSQGITIFLTSHWLQEVEQLCDRIAIMDQGLIRACGSMTELRREIGLGERYYLQVRGYQQNIQEQIQAHVTEFTASPDEGEDTRIEFELPEKADRLTKVLDLLRDSGAIVSNITTEPVSLERIFSRLTSNSPPGPLSLETPALHKGDGTKRFTTAISQNAVEKPPSYRPDTLGWFLKQMYIAWAFLKRDVREEASYRLAFILQFLNIFFTVGLFYFIARLLGDAATPHLEPYGGDYFSFVLIGIAFAGYFGVGLSSFSSSLRQAQTTGTLEAMLTTPTGLSTVILSSSLWSYLITTVRVVIYLLVGVVLLGVHLETSNYLAAVIILFLTVISFSSLGILAASFIMVLKRGDPITWLFNATSSILGGVYYPVTILPGWMQFLAALIPVTYALRAMRLALLQGAPFRELFSDILVLVIFSLTLLPASLLAFRYAVRRAKADGSLSHF
jgi:ABC-2 type transport system permease protein